MLQKETVSKHTTLSIVSTALLGFAGILSETSMNVTFPTLQKVFQLPLSSLQWITTVYLLAVSVSRLPVERKADETAIFQMMQQFAGALGAAIASVIAGASSNLTVGVQRVLTLQLVCVVYIFFMFYCLFQELKKVRIK